MWLKGFLILSTKKRDNVNKKKILYNLTLNLLAHYHMMKTTIVKHLLYSYTLFLRVFKTHSLHSLIFNYIEYFILIYIVTYLTLCK